MLIAFFNFFCLLSFFLNSVILFLVLKVPITPKIFFPQLNHCVMLSKKAKKICFWLKVEFSMNFQIAEKPLPGAEFA